MASVLLDASALLAVIFEEPGRDVVLPFLGDAAMSSLNYTEAISRQMRAGADSQIVLETMRAFGLEVIPWDQEMAERATDLHYLGWTLGISLGDRACLATARYRKLAVLTTEQKWRKLPNLGIDIRVIR